MKKGVTGYEEALKMTLETISPLGRDQVDLPECTDRIIADDLYALVNSPSIDASMKDGYAVRSDEIEQATHENMVRLNVIGMAAAGVPTDKAVSNGTAIRILTGAKIPDGANAVLAEEFVVREGDVVSAFENAEPGRNILPKGDDVEAGKRIATKGSRLSPGMIGILAAAGHSKLPVYHRPRLAIVATGDELMVPGQPFSEGKLYASNLYILNSWCLRYGMTPTLSLVSDKPEVITEKLAQAIATHDAVITIGGAWTGDRDFVANTLKALGWKQLFHRIRMGPGKGVGFGVLDQKPVFMLPGGPPSSLMAFLQIALPGLLRLAGHNKPFLPRMMVKLSEKLISRDMKWTHFVYGSFRAENEHTFFDPAPLRLVANRLKAIAHAEGVIAIPEGVKSLSAGAVIPAQLLV
ncbi:molybdopterin molybdotransferase MoeA [Desulfonema magnum]|uniref:Molybdopterin molybdenumtransferase n=1 Tax=Desulfonema magnum TaxID=45655 RepID=A0A975BSR7_9BACT|nr:molybdopterin molybdotransferase MoeA [Desulfonema magnum]QTA90935.1 Putative molybdopterin molybdenumtransferase, MoeA-like [Desulfonema magnum]